MKTKQLETKYRIKAFLLASPVYWPDEEQRRAQFSSVKASLRDPDSLLETVTIDSEQAATEARDPGSKEPCVLIALSGGIQPWMQLLSEGRDQLALFNAYLPEALPVKISGPLMHANAHPASTDFYAYCRQSGKSIQWLSSLKELHDYAIAWQGICRLKNARFLKIGETEPWVINSCRSPETIKQRVGCEVIPMERDQLYAIYETITEEEAQAEAQSWIDRNQTMIGIKDADILKASRVTLAMRRALANHQADGLSMACFAMIGDIDTTSCLALSALNDSASEIGACEGDLDAGLTLFLLKSMGADFVWIGNPIIHPDNTIDLAHCTAPTCACGSQLNFKLMRHHESGRGVSPEVELPGDQIASATRISVNAQSIVCHVGTTERRKKLPACNTQIRLHVESSQQVLDSLPGTHLVLSYGDFGKRIEFATHFLGFENHATQATPSTVAARNERTSILSLKNLAIG